jgi:hypothetical protein
MFEKIEKFKKKEISKNYKKIIQIYLYLFGLLKE